MNKGEKLLSQQSRSTDGRRLNNKGVDSARRTKIDFIIQWGSDLLRTDGRALQLLSDGQYRLTENHLDDLVRAMEMISYKMGWDDV